MSDTTQSKDQPAFKIGCSRKKGVDRFGKDILGYPVIVAAVWPRADKQKGYRIDWDIVPAELPLDQVVTFLFPNEKPDDQNAQTVNNPASMG